MQAQADFTCWIAVDHLPLDQCGAGDVISIWRNKSLVTFTISFSKNILQHFYYVLNSNDFLNRLPNPVADQKIEFFGGREEGILVYLKTIYNLIQISNNYDQLNIK